LIVLIHSFILVVFTLGLIANTYAMENNYSRAEELYLKAIEISKRIPDDVRFFHCIHHDPPTPAL